MKKNSTIIGVVSDNASNILLATTDKSQPGPKINLQNQVTNIQSLIGMRTLHISCGIHTSNLVLKDMMVDNGFKSFKEGLLKLFKFLREKDIRIIAKEKGIYRKIPLIQEIKWLCYLQAIEFLDSFRNQIDEILLERFKQRDSRIDFNSVPKEWDPYMLCLKPYSEFILICQKSSFLLHEFHQQLSKLLEIWYQMNTRESKMLFDLMVKRFINTSYGALAKLSWFLTKEGHDFFRNKFRILFQPNMESFLNSQYLSALIGEKREIVDTFIKVHKYYGFNNEELFIPILIDKFLLWFEFTGEPLNEQYTRLGNNQIMTQYGRFSWASFAITASNIVSLPASESIAERVISHMSDLFPKNRSSANFDLVEAQIMIRMQSIFDEENAAFNLSLQ